MLAVDLDQTLIDRCREKANQHGCITYSVADVQTNDGRRVISSHLDRHSIQKFDVVTCFSVTMWLHLHHGDDGLRDFLSYASGVCDRLLIEPQPWSCYRNAVRRMQKLNCQTFPAYSELMWRQNVHLDIEQYLEKSCCMKLQTKYGETENWKRPLFLFTRVS